MTYLTNVFGGALVTVLLVSGFGKFVGRVTVFELMSAFAELAVAALIIAQRLIEVAAIGACLLSATFVVVSIRASANERCRCFGAALPSTSRAGQRARNLLLLGCAGGYAAIVVTGDARPVVQFAGTLLGGVLGVALVVLPWTVEWAWGRPGVPAVDVIDTF